MLGISPSLSLNELHKSPKPYGKSGNGRTLYANDNIQRTLGGLKTQAQGSGHQAYHAQAVTRAVEQLRAGPGMVNSFAKEGNPCRRCVVHAGFEIEYEINHTGLNQTDIYIVDIRLLDSRVRDTERAGLWNVEKDRKDGWVPRKWQSSLKPIHSKGADYTSRIKIGVNGYCNNIRHASRMLPSHIARGDKNEMAAMPGYQLLFVPSKKNVVKAGWQSVQHMGQVYRDGNQIEAAQILAAHMREAHEKGLYVEWTSQRGGSFVLTEAMKLLAKPQPGTGKPLDLQGKQQVFFSDPTTSMVEADTARRKINTNTQSAKWYNGSKFNLGYAMGAQQMGVTPIACSFNGAAGETAARKAGAYATWGVGAGGAAAGLYQAAAAAATTTGVSFGMAVALVNTVLATIPSLNEDYHASSTQSLGTLVNKGCSTGKQLANKLLG